MYNNSPYDFSEESQQENIRQQLDHNNPMEQAPFPMYQQMQQPIYQPMQQPIYQPMQQPIHQPIPQMENQMQLPVTGAAPVDFETLPVTPVLDVEYTQGYLKTQIGQRIKVEFLIGTNMLVDREGTLVDVGISYIIIREVETDDLLLCDIYSIKFVRFYY